MKAREHVWIEDKLGPESNFVYLEAKDRQRCSWFSLVFFYLVGGFKNTLEENRLCRLYNLGEVESKFHFRWYKLWWFKGVNCPWNGLTKPWNVLVCRLRQVGWLFWRFHSWILSQIPGESRQTTFSDNNSYVFVTFYKLGILFCQSQDVLWKIRTWRCGICLMIETINDNIALDFQIIFSGNWLNLNYPQKHKFHCSIFRVCVRFFVDVDRFFVDRSI